ncbi:MAG: DUF58 domain-containing protein [Chitinophagaceae bacterium]|nr:MAG: von Willebrand factor A [Bacteroidetes bacterium OLB11]MCC6447324.1 DUF58 domain-containing protein [Chitinophagaceae bacterium]HMN32779.1 DUF58 domain-containing protein [Chitinophagaceae bacterium]
MNQNYPIENLELLAKQVVEGFIIGLHKSPFHGFSVEFAEHRIYNQGDNLKHIDWKVYGRSDKLFIKKFEEETNLRCQIVIDTSSSMLFPEEKNTLNKLQFSCLSAASIITLLKKQLDAVGLTLFDSNIYYHSKAKSSATHTKILMTELEKLLNKNEQQLSTEAVKSLHQIAESIHKRSLVVIFSDMLDRVSESEELFDALQHLKYNKHEVILFHVQDKKCEVDFEFENRPYEFVDLETGEKLRMNSTQLKELYQNKMHSFRNALALKCNLYGIDIINADIREGYEKILYSYLIKRNKMV